MGQVCYRGVRREVWHSAGSVEEGVIAGVLGVSGVGIRLAEPMSFSAAEKLLLAALIAASMGVFAWRLGPIARNVWGSKKDTDFSLRPVGKRVWKFFWEVLCQAKVIRQRPLPGLAHAFVFWGFLAFALVSLNHLAVGFGHGFLQYAGAFGTFYVVFAGVWAVLVAVGISGLFVRRFLVRPKWLGEKVSIESGVIAGLIFLLMVSYLAALFVADGGVAAASLWWVHTLTLLAFLPIIPGTKHLHLVLSPLTVFLKRPEFSQLPKLEGDGDFGLVAGRDLTQMIALQAYSCVECGRCTEHCPAANTGKVLNPKEIVLGVRSYLNAVGPGSEMPLLDGAEKALSMEAAFECTTCGACEYQCPVGVQHLPVLIGLRRGAVNTGAWEDRYGTKLFLALEKQGNSLGMSWMERDKFIAKEGFSLFDGSQEYCLWLGCMGSYDPKGREIVSDFARVMRALGAQFGVLKKEKCTGDPARRLGNDLLFGELAEQGLKAFATAGVKKIVTICPHCVRTIATDWREYGVAPEIEHHSEFMARHAHLLPKQEGGSIVYHDPCYLGRYRDVYDEPRAVVATAGELVEAERHRERSFCCGAGGGLAFLGEESGARVSHVRAQELIATGAKTIGTACPFCNSMFRDALGAVGGEHAPQLLDIAQLVARGLAAKDSAGE
jgi:Fe-S oxidoreductase